MTAAGAENFIASHLNVLTNDLLRSRAVGGVNNVAVAIAEFSPVGVDVTDFNGGEAFLAISGWRLIARARTTG